MKVRKSVAICKCFLSGKLNINICKKLKVIMVQNMLYMFYKLFKIFDGQAKELFLYTSSPCKTQNFNYSYFIIIAHFIHHLLS